MLNSTLNNMLSEDPEPEIGRLMVEKIQWREPEKAVLDTVSELRKIKKENLKRKLRAELDTTTDPERKMQLLKEISLLK